MREENSPSIEKGKEEEENSKNFPQVLWEEEYGGEFPSSREEMEEIREFYSEILEWRNFHMNGNMGENFLLPSPHMKGEIHEKFHSLILEEGILFIEYSQEFLHSMRMKGKISSPEELENDFKIYMRNS